MLFKFYYSANSFRIFVNYYCIRFNLKKLSSSLRLPKTWKVKQSSLIYVGNLSSAVWKAKFAGYTQFNQRDGKQTMLYKCCYTGKVLWQKKAMSLIDPPSYFFIIKTWQANWTYLSSVLGWPKSHLDRGKLVYIYNTLKVCPS